MLSTLPNADEVLRFLAPDETASQFFLRAAGEHIQTGLGLIDNNLSLRPGVVLEAAGPHGSGKTELLLHAALNVLFQGSTVALPNVHQDNPTHPEMPTGQVVLLDLDGKFEPARLAKVRGSS